MLTCVSQNHEVLVGTAEVFRKALVDNRFIHLAQFSLLILDECHNATGTLGSMDPKARMTDPDATLHSRAGNSAMAGILIDAYHPAAKAVCIHMVWSITVRI